MQWTWHFFYPGNLTAKESWVFTALSVHTFKVTFNRTEIFLSLSFAPSFSLKLWIGPCRVSPWLKFNGIHYGEGGVLRELQEPWLPPAVLGPTHCQREKSGLAEENSNQIRCWKSYLKRTRNTHCGRKPNWIPWHWRARVLQCRYECTVTMVLIAPEWLVFAFESIAVVPWLQKSAEIFTKPSHRSQISLERLRFAWRNADLRLLRCNFRICLCELCRGYRGFGFPFV